MGIESVRGQNPQDMKARMAQMQQMREAFGASSPKAVTQPQQTQSTQAPGMQQAGGNTNAFAQAAQGPQFGSGIDFGKIAAIGAPKGAESSQALGPAQATNKAVDLNNNGAQAGGYAAIPGGGMSVVGSKFMRMG